MTDTFDGRPEPSNKDIFDALQGFAVSYHDLHQTLARIEAAAQASQVESQATRAESQDERQLARIRFDALFSRVGELADKMAKQFQRAWDELDALRAALDELKVEFDRRLDVKRDRLNAHEQRLAALEAAIAARPSPEKARATYDGVRRIMAHLGLEDSGDVH